MQGREAVRRSVLKSIQDLQLDYLDICYVHWPVPGRYIETYKELQQLVKEKKISAIGISNFTIEEYETLMADPDISIRPQIHQFEVSPFMYRPQYIQYFQNRGIMVAASKALNRASGIITANDREAQDDGIGSIVDRIAVTHNVSSAQIMLRWSFQKDLIVLAKTSNPHRMKENRGIISFELSLDEMKMLDGITTEGDIDARAKLEEERKRGS
jgi:diketogulonate reductase-like aldo/keto reductase